MSKTIEIEGLIKTFGDVRAVDGISFDVKEGSLFAFLGLNGAGKSTTINVICSLLKKDAGKVRVLGYDLDREADQIKNQIGIVFQNSVLDSSLSVRDNLSVRASYYGLYGASCRARIEQLSKALDLGEVLSRPYGKLSGGWRRRVDVARGLLCSPKLLILDEPTTGLDPQSRHVVWSVITDLQKQTGMTVFLTTHYMEESAKADDVVILDGGKIAARGTPSELKERYSGDFILLHRPDTESIRTALKNANFTYENNAYKIRVQNGAEAKAFLKCHDDIVDDFEVVKGDMDDVFLSVTGKKLGEAQV